ncbi:MAG: transglycosylase SLT domain-containing protein [Fibromonadaceae bacterium]|jgi:soluble lytic murein transglycosylase|nr:transglycosylase SLT domain-containing protein [Fibromonadaceae bacterium]
MKFLLLLILVCSSLLFAQVDDPNSDIELELMLPDALKNELLRRELIAQGNDAVDPFTLELTRAAVFYYNKKWDSAYFAYMPLLEKASDFLYGPLVVRIAKCELERGNIQESRKLLLSLKSLRSNKSSWERADRILVEGILRDTAITENAKRDSIAQRTRSKPSTSYDQFLKWNLAKIHERQDNPNGARDAYFSILRGGGVYADSAFRALLRLAPASTDYDFVRNLCRRGHHERCAERTGSILANKSVRLDSARWVNLMVFQAEAWRQSEKADLAIANYTKLLDSIGYNPAWMQSLLRMVRNAGNRQEVRRLDSIFQARFPFRVENANNLWVKALEFEQAGEHKKAIETYRRLYDSRFGKNQRRQWAKFRVGFINFKEEKYAEAAKIFTEAANENLGLMPRSAALFFNAECERIMENEERATRAYFAVISDFPLGYYAWRARQRLAEYGVPEENIPKIGRKMSQDSVTIWLRALQKREAGGRDTIVSVERLEQIRTLLRSGFEEEAFVLYNEALRLHKNRPEFYYRYGLMFMQNGEHALGHRLARNFLDMVSRQRMAGAPIQVLQFLFPTPHEDKIKKHSKIDHFLIYSVIRQESMFDAKITSPAGARGLMQIMPATGEFLAKRERIENFNKDMLYNAFLNIRLGVRLLNDLTAEHKGDYIGILGEYNAGPTPTRRWMTNHGSLPWDVRVEEVSFWETRDYVKRVLGNYWTYTEIYD